MNASALQTDLYQLTMAAALWKAGVDHEVTFELFTRRLHPRRGMWIAAGLEQAVDYLRGLRFTPEQLAFLRGLPVFADTDPGFFAALADLRFTGEVWAIPEGTPVFPYEPLLRLRAPALVAQLVETRLLAMINFQTLIASKAARVAEACGAKRFLEFGTRRAHGPEAGQLAARAAYVAGAAGTSNVEAGLRFGVPVSGTFAHAWVMQFPDEDQAFRAYGEAFPGRTTLLVDTYDTLAAVRRIVDQEIPCRAVRLDSGDLGALAREVRALLDAGGRREVQIVASSDLDEDRIAELEAQGAPIDVFGVGTALATSKDVPALGGVYKLVAVHPRDGETWHPVKLASEKGSWPGAKQVYRRRDATGYAGDWVALAEEAPPADATPLLEPVLRDGELLRPHPALA
ncbi:MAG: nicotinate phosphoribosyltransferase, partial [Planctomycetes bacterium]|nr:nicotinate phosphoribosyltransferase [Planctomycetota bacterium]